MTNIDQLLARLEMLEARLLPPIDPGWGTRTCQVCGALAEVIDADTVGRLDGTLPKNGEGYCREHVPDDVMADGHERLEKP